MGTMQREEQIAQAEELLEIDSISWALSKVCSTAVIWQRNCPSIPARRDDATTQNMATKLRAFCRDSIDPVKIDRESVIPDAVIHGLGELGVLVRACPKAAEGRGSRRRTIASC